MNPDNPTTGEWTVEYIVTRIGLSPSAIADAHNAAVTEELNLTTTQLATERHEAKQQLAAEREKYDAFEKYALEQATEADNKIEQLREQLADEQELREEAEKEATLLRDQWLGEHAELQEQLAADQEKVSWLKSQLKLSNDALSPAQQEIQQLREQLAADRELREEAEQESKLLRDEWLGEHGKLQSQLAAEQEAGVKALAERSFELHKCQKQLAAGRENSYPRFRCLVCKKGANELATPHYLERVSSTGKGAVALWLCTEHLSVEYVQTQVWKRQAEGYCDDAHEARKQLAAAEEALDRVSRACTEELTLPYYKATNTPAVMGTFVALQQIADAALAKISPLR